MSSIIEQARADGYKAGYRDGADFWSNYNQSAMDEAFQDGHAIAQATGLRRMTRWLFGLLCGLAPSVWAFWP